MRSIYSFKKKLWHLLMLNLGLLLFFACGNDHNGSDPNGLKGYISLSGAFALYPLTVKWAEEFQEIHPGVRIDISAGGAGKGMADALARQVDLGMVSRDVYPAEIKKGAWIIPVAKDAVLPTFNSANPYAAEILKRGLTKKEFKDLWVEGKPLSWALLAGKAPTADLVRVYKRSDAAGAAESWAAYLEVKQDNLKGTGVFGDPGLAEAVKNDPYGVGFNNVIYIYDLNTKNPYPGLQVLPIDINQNGLIDSDENFYKSLDVINQAIADGKYPSPPARELYFVSQGKPRESVVKEFLDWVLTDGQKFVKEAGFIPLEEEKIAEIKSKLH